MNSWLNEQGLKWFKNMAYKKIFKDDDEMTIPTLVILIVTELLVFKAIA